MNFLVDVMEFIGEDELSVEQLTDPNSKETCFILYLWSLESPFADQLFKVHDVQNNEKMLEYFGPIDRALQEIFNGADQNRIDRLYSSSVITSPTSFLLFKGAALTEDEIITWKNNIGNQLELLSNTSFTE